MRHIDMVKDLLKQEAQGGGFSLDAVSAVSRELRARGMSSMQMQILVRQAMLEMKGSGSANVNAGPDRLL